MPEWNGTSFPDPENQEPGTGSGGGIVLDDFIAYLPTHQYYHVPTGAMWAAISINTKITGLFENGKEISAST